MNGPQPLSDRLEDMTISVSFFGLQRKIIGSDHIRVTLSREATVADIVYYLAEHYPDLKVNENQTLIAINNRVGNLTQALKADDNVSFLPHIGGG